MLLLGGDRCIEPREAYLGAWILVEEVTCTEDLGADRTQTKSLIMRLLQLQRYNLGRAM